MDKDEVKVFIIAQIISEPDVSGALISVRMAHKFNIGFHPSERLVEDALFEMDKEGIIFYRGFYTPIVLVGETY